MKHVSVILAALLVLGGCSKKPPAPAAPRPSGTTVTAGKTAVPGATPQVSPAPSPLPAGVIMVVEGKALKRDDLDKKVKDQLLRIMPPNMGDRTPLGSRAEVEQGLRRQIMDEFITRTVLLARAEKEKIAITPEDEQQAFERIKANNNLNMSLAEFVNRNPLGGDGLQMIREEAHIDKVLAPYRTMPIEVTQQEMDDYTSRTSHLLGTPERVHARRVLVAVSPDDSEEVRAAKKAKAEKAREELARGAEFAQVAASYSDGPEKVKGGDMGTFKVGARFKNVEAVSSQGEGAIGPVVQTDAGYEIIQVVERIPAGTLDRNTLKDMLANKKRTDAQNQFVVSLKDAADIQAGDDDLHLLKLR